MRENYSHPFTSQRRFKVMKTFPGCIPTRLVLLLGCLLLGMSLHLPAQDTVWVKPKYVNKGSWMIGSDFSGAGVAAKNQATGQVNRVSILQFDPKIAYFPSKWFCVGGEATLGLVRGNTVANFNYHGLGGFARFYPFAKVQERILRAEEMQFMGISTFQRLRARDRDFLAQHFFPFIEAGISWSDLRILPNAAPQRVNSLSELRLVSALGTDFRIWKGLSIALAFAVPYYPNNPDNIVGSPGIRIGVEWFLRKKTNE